jgi:hypothetical protein
MLDGDAPHRGMRVCLGLVFVAVVWLELAGEPLLYVVPFGLARAEPKRRHREKENDHDDGCPCHSEEGDSCAPVRR